MDQRLMECIFIYRAYNFLRCLPKSCSQIVLASSAFSRPVAGQIHRVVVHQAGIEWVDEY